MALINCPECNNQVSDEAMVCPSCGKRLKKKKSYLLSIILIIIGLGCLVAAYSIKNSDALNTQLGYVREYGRLNFDEFNYCFDSYGNKVYYDSRVHRYYNAVEYVEQCQKILIGISICGAVFLVCGVTTAVIKKKSKAKPVN